MGGAEASLIDMIWSLRQRLPNARIDLISGTNGPLVDGAAKAGAKVTVMQMPPALASLGDSGMRSVSGTWIKLSVIVRSVLKLPLFIRYAALLRQTLISIAPDVIHSNGFKMHVLAALAAPRRSVIIWHVHDYVNCRPVMSQALRLLKGRCSAVITSSGSVTNDVRASLSGKLDVTTILNAVDLERFSPRGTTIDLDVLSGVAPVDGTSIRVGLIGTFARWKGHQVFLQALALLPKPLVLRAFIIGGPIYNTTGSQHSVADLRAHAATLGIGHLVGFTGPVGDSASAIRALDIVVHASTSPEPFGLVIVEAMACGKPVIVSLAGGVSEIVEPDINALTHEPGDTESLSAQLYRLIGDPGLRMRLGLQGRQTAETRFNRTRLAEQILAVYRRALRWDSIPEATYNCKEELVGN